MTDNTTRFMVVSAGDNGGNDFQWILDFVIAADKDAAKEFIRSTRDTSDITAYSIWEWRELANDLENMPEDELTEYMEELALAFKD